MIRPEFFMKTVGEAVERLKKGGEIKEGREVVEKGEGETEEERRKKLWEVILGAMAFRVSTIRSVKQAKEALDNLSNSLTNKTNNSRLSEDDLNRVGGFIEQIMRRVVSEEVEGGLVRLVRTKISRGDYKGAVEVLRKVIEEREKRGEVNSDEANEWREWLDVVGDDSREVGKVEVVAKEVVGKNEGELDELRKMSERVGEAVLQKQIEGEIDKGKEEDDGDLEIELSRDMKRSLVEELGELEVDGEDKQVVRGLKRRFLKKKRSRYDLSEWDIEEARGVWLQSSYLLEKYKDQLGDDSELGKFLEEVSRKSRARIDEILENEALMRALRTPGQERLRKLSEGELKQIMDDLEFMQRFSDSDSFLNEQERVYGSEVVSKTNIVLRELLRERSDLEGKLVKEGRVWKWRGTAEEYFDLMRSELYKIQGQLLEENLSNLIFEESAATYMALMRVDVSGNPKLKSVKDAVVKTLYIQFAIRSLWKGGANEDVWRRAASILTQESEESFFRTMKLGEMLRVKDGKGQEIDVARFDINDIMTIAEEKAPNGQYWMVYLSGQSVPLRQKRRRELVVALAKKALEKTLLKGEISEEEFDNRVKLLEGGKVEFNNQQMDWIVNYLHYMSVATLRAGEYGLDQSIKRDKFEFVDLPGGEIAQKLGPWMMAFFHRYGVTKYAGELLGKLFAPTASILSYARGEVWAHFVSENSSVEAGIYDERDRNLGVIKTRVSADGMFFNEELDDGELKRINEVRKGKRDINSLSAKERSVMQWVDFWGDVMFNERTGSIKKTAVMRSMSEIRRLGLKKFRRLKKEGGLKFVNEVNFKKFEAMLGHEIPGGNNEEKFKWMIENFSYDFMNVDNFKSKRVADWVNKYVFRYFMETYKVFQEFLNDPGLHTLAKLRGVISGFTDETVFQKQGMAALDTLRKRSWRGWLKPTNKWKKDGDWWEVELERKSPFWGWYPGRGLLFSMQEGKERMRAPMYWKKLEIKNAARAGQISHEEEAQLMRDWRRDVYWGAGIKMGRFKLRPGYFLPLAPIFWFRGWWVNNLELDWNDFMIAVRKTNEEEWERLKKYFQWKW